MMKELIFKYVTQAFFAGLFVLAPIVPALKFIIVLVFCDMILGVWASLKQGHSITSKSLRRTVAKLLVYEVAACLTFLTEIYLIPEFPFSRMVLALIALVECKSFFENLYRITKIDLAKQIIDIIQVKQNKDMVTGLPKRESKIDPKG